MAEKNSLGALWPAQKKSPEEGSARIPAIKWKSAEQQQPR